MKGGKPYVMDGVNKMNGSVRCKSQCGFKKVFNSRVKGVNLFALKQ